MAWTPPSVREILHRSTVGDSADWRWRAAQFLIAKGREPTIDDDNHLRSAFDYLTQSARSNTDSERANVDRRWPQINAAHRLHEGGSVLRDEVRARLLCQPVEIVARKVGVGADLIETYAAIFFDVLSKKGANDWLLLNATGYENWGNRPPIEGEIWAYMALAGGPFVLDVLIDDFHGRSDPNLPRQAEIAAGIRQRVLSYAATQYPDRYDQRAIVAEDIRLIQKWSESHNRPIPLSVAGAIESLQMMYKLPRRRARSVKRDKPGRTGRREHSDSVVAADALSAGAAEYPEVARSAVQRGETELLGAIGDRP